MDKYVWVENEGTHLCAAAMWSAHIMPPEIAMKHACPHPSKWTVAFVAGAYRAEGEPVVLFGFDSNAELEQVKAKC
jgi:hypothetical protein